MLNIKDGLVLDDKLGDIKIVRHLIPDSNLTQYTMLPLGICIHNPASSGNAQMHTEYVDGLPYYKYTNWHLTIGAGIVYQELPFCVNAWHATDGEYGYGNRNFIAIEIMENEEAYQTAIIFIRELIETFGWNVDEVVLPHQYFYPSKYCPRKILPRWSSFIEDLKRMNPIEIRLRRYPKWLRRIVASLMQART